MELKTVTIRAVLLVLSSTLSIAAFGFADTARQVDIPAGDLSRALRQLATQYGVELVYRPEQVHGLKTYGAHGELTTEQAVSRLLRGTQLKIYTDSSGAILIAPPRPNMAADPVEPSAGEGSNAAQQAGVEGTEANSSQQETESNPSSRSRLQLVQLDQGQNSNAPTVGERTANAVDNSKSLDEIIVTAQKKNENLMDVPVPVTAISAETLADRNQFRLEDYYSRIPGVSLTPGAFDGEPNLSIRGITTGGISNPTVGITIDDLPFGSSTQLGGGTEAPDIDPSDLVRVEVLRGPQGTLYGASSIGGLLKYVTADPSTDAVSGRVQAGTSSVYNGAELGYSVRGSINYPLSDTLAVRASAFMREDPGYIDNVLTQQNGVNKMDAEGGHVSALWKLPGEVKLKLSALYQYTKAFGSSLVNFPYNLSGLQQVYGPVLNSVTSLGDLQQVAPLGYGGYGKTIQAYSATLNGKIGNVDLVVLSGYNINSVSESLDFTPLFGPVTLGTYGVSGTPVLQNNRTGKFTQEFRLSASIGNHVDWLFGAFYTRENNTFIARILATNPTTGQLAGIWLDADNFPTTYKEFAGFGDLTFHITDRFKLQIGARESQNRQTYMETVVGPYAPVFLGLPSPAFNPEIKTQDNSFTYLATPQFNLSPDLMLYARLASGYRPGGPNPFSTSYHLPSTYNPDKTNNYEIGFKGEFLNHTLSVDTSLYYIDWKNIELQLTAPSGFAYYANGSGAKSEGVELSVESRPLTGLTITAWVAYDDAALTEALPAGSTAYGVSGDRLPYSSRFSGNIALEQNFHLTDRVTAFVGGAENYVGGREGPFTSPPPAAPPRQAYSSYSKVDLRAGAKYDSWTLDLFLNNVADKRGVLGGGLGTYTPLGFNIITPRTVGLAVAKTF